MPDPLNWTENVGHIVNWLNGYIWSYALIVLCLGIGLYLSVATRFLQLRYFFHMFALMFQSGGASDEKRGISSFQALAVSVSGRVGTGNIAGVATAIGAGGPGALFWMWVMALLGAATSFVECSLGQMYKIEDDGEFRGGPAYYIERGLGWRPYAVFFAFASLLCYGLLLPGIQANSIVSGFQQSFELAPAHVLIPVCVILALIIFGGIQRISHVAEFLIPFMAVGYVLTAGFIIFSNLSELPAVFSKIFAGAFGQDAALGGILGATISWGVKRGLYSNEAGQGSGPHAASAAAVDHPAQQGFVQALSVYIDTLFICTATGLMILLAGTYNVKDMSGNFLLENVPGIESGPAYTQLAVDSVLQGYGGAFVAVSLFFFAFTTILSYYYIAETNLAYLFQKKDHHLFNNLLRFAVIAAVIYGGLKPAKLAWAIGDLGIGISAWLNIIALLFLATKGVQILRDYDRKYKAKQSLKFNPKDFGIDDEQEIWK